MQNSIRFAYHGTAAKNVESILENGLLPREETGKSNWADGDVESIQDHVYLTKQHGIAFGISATEDDEDVALIEIDISRLRPSNLYPDEDYIEQAINRFGLKPHDGYRANMGIENRTEQVRENIGHYKGAWRDSMNIMGTMSHKGKIPPHAISRVSTMDLPGWFKLNIDPTFSIELGLVPTNKYEIMTEIVMGEDVSPKRYIESTFPGDFEQLEEVNGKAAGYMKSREREAKKIVNADFFEVRENPQYE